MDISKIKYLSFEGGGGKGNAYLGSLMALQKLGIIKYENNKLISQIKGISGASAGAITALLISSGYAPSEIYKMAKAKFFFNFFDNPEPGIRIRAGNSEFSSKLNSLSTYNAKESALLLVIKNLLKIDLGKFDTHALKMLFNIFLDNNKSIWMYIYSEVYKQNFQLAEKLHNNYDLYFESLKNDLGVFSGKNIHVFFNNLISMKKFAIENKLDLFSNPNNMKKAQEYATKMFHEKKMWNFQEFFDVFKIDVKFSSVNIKTGRLHILSKDTTPQLPVATGVRMSMSIPFIFKPVEIEAAGRKKMKMQDSWEGLWIDGGVLDNIPVSYFNDPSSVLAFRLKRDEEEENIKNLFKFTKAYLMMLLLGTGSKILAEPTGILYNYKIIYLNIYNTKLLKFDLEDSELDSLTTINANLTLTELGIKIDPKMGWAF